MPNFNTFQNKIYLGSYSSTVHDSFDGYLKELRIFSKFHSFDQLSVDKLKLYKKYSFDDPNLAHWPLSEAYNASSPFYKLQDYSVNLQSVTIYAASNPDYPSFIDNSLQSLSLCNYHDVAECLTVGKDSLAKYVFGGWRYSYAPALTLTSSTITIQDGDEIHFSPTSDCQNEDASLYRTYGRWEEQALLSKGTDKLTEGQHYYLCYYSSSFNVKFSIAQVYNAHIIDKISPVELSTFRTAGVSEKWLFEGGDQAYGDTILFSPDCNSPSPTDLKITSRADGLYDSVDMTTFPSQQNIFFCFKSAFSDPADLTYEPIRHLEYKIVEKPVINTLNKYTLVMNYDTKPFTFDGPMAETDAVTLSWSGVSRADCNPINFMNDEGYKYQHGFLPYIWYGRDSGIHGMNSSSDELHFCWKSSARGAPDNWIRLRSAIGSTFIMRVLEIDNAAYMSLPELEYFDPAYGTTTATENTTEIKFNFHDEEVFPADHPTHGNGILRIYRGAINDDGTIDKASGAPVLWESTSLNDTAVNDKFKQGNVECSLSGE